MSLITTETGKIGLGAVALAFLPLWPGLLQGQTMAELDRLVFEPALVPDTATTRQQPPSRQPASLPFRLPETGADEPPTALAQYRDIATDKTDYLETITDVETEDGAYADALLENLVSLGSLYQQEGNHEKAIETFERAEHVSRINHGLFDASQFPIIEKSIDSYLAVGDIDNVLQYQRYLVYLNEKYYGKNASATVDSMAVLANRNMDVYTSIINRNEPVVSFSFSSPGGSGPSESDDPRRQVFGNLRIAQGNYARAILALIENREFFSTRILELEYKFLETLFLQANRRAILDDPDFYLSERSSSITGSHLMSPFSRRNSFGYIEGKNTFDRILIYLKHNPDAPPEALATAMMDFGDWHLLFGRNMNAVRQYEQAYDLLQAEGVDPAVVSDLVKPAIPLQLPLITAKPNSREKFGLADDVILQPDGYIDIAFTINRYGNARKIRVLDKSENTTAAVERRLKRYLRNAPFRLRMVDGETMKADPVTLRYYYTLLPESA